MRFPFRFIVALVLFAAVYIGSREMLYDEQKVMFTSQSNLSDSWTLPVPVIKALAGEFKGVVADLIVFKAGAELGTEVIRDESGGEKVAKKNYDWNNIVRLFKVSQELDPYFQHTYMVAQGWLPWTAKRYDDVFDILLTAKLHRPWDWMPSYYMGFNTYYFLKKPGEAGKLFLEASAVPDAPPLLAILGSRLAQKGGETQAAIALMKTMLVQKKESDLGYQDMVDRLHALEGTWLIEQAVKRYEKTYGHIPASLTDLTGANILANLPDNPYNVAYCLDEEGVVYFDRPDCRKAPAN